MFFSVQAEPGKLTIVLEEEPSFDKPCSQLATAKQFSTEAFAHWCNEMQLSVSYHRKLWEFCYILQSLQVENMIAPEKRGLGFGVGTEPLPAIFAKHGCYITASDQDFESALKQGWVDSNQHTYCKESLNKQGICESEQFNSLVELKSIDMNNIGSEFYDTYDFVWSSCALEHLGSLKAGAEFIKNSIKCLKPGGIAVHTTEYNLSSLENTLEKGGTVLYRRRDIIDLLLELTSLGYDAYSLNIFSGNEPVDQFIDVAPYKQDPHLKLEISKYVSTSIGIIVKKPN